MFGYIKTCTPQLRLCEWEAYRGIYCGLCRTLGRRFGPLARLTLSYDFTFYATLEMALREEVPEKLRGEPAAALPALRGKRGAEPSGGYGHPEPVV